MALNYGDNYVLKIKKGSTEYLVRDSIAEAAINTIQGNAENAGSIAKAQADAQSYTDTAITTLTNAIDEQNEVTAAALTDLDSRISTLDSGAVKSVTEGSTNGTVSVDGTDVAVHGLGTAAYTASTAYDAAGTAAAAVAALDATPSQAAGTDGLALSLTQVDGVVTGISGSIAANTYDAYGAASTVQTTLIGAANDATSADTIHGAKNYAKGIVDNILGEDSASTTLATLKQVIQELNAPENQNGITGTFIDTVKAGLSGLGETAPVYYTQEEIDAAQEGDEAYGKTTDDVKTPARPVTVKEYVDDAVAGASSSASSAIAALDAEVTSNDGTNVQVKVTEVDGVITAVSVTTDNTVNATDVGTAITTAIEALDATPSQAAGTDGLALSLTQVDGVVTGISGSIAANTYDAYGAASTAASGVVGASGDDASANTVYGAKAYTDNAITALGTTKITNGVLELPF